VSCQATNETWRGTIAIIGACAAVLSLLVSIHCCRGVEGFGHPAVFLPTKAQVGNLQNRPTYNLTHFTDCVVRPRSGLGRRDHHAAPAAGVRGGRGGVADWRGADAAAGRAHSGDGSRHQLPVDGLPRALRARDAAADAARRPLSDSLAAGALLAVLSLLGMRRRLKCH